MPSLKDQIIKNLIVHADFSSDAIDREMAIEIADAFRVNTLVTSIDFAYSNINDSNFDLIAKALIDRNLPLVKLNLDMSKLTSKSLDVLKQLMQAGLVGSILMYRLKDVHTNNSLQDDFKKFAEDCEVSVSFDHPDTRPNNFEKKSNIRLFDNRQEELKEGFASENHQREGEEPNAPTLSIKKKIT